MEKQREIKFRAYHEGHGRKAPARMVYDDKPGDSLRWLADGQPVFVMQFTGLRDRTGKEVYEGDVLRVDFRDPGYKPINVVVEWNNDDVCWYVGAPGQYLTVIGNVYEHPELLSQ
jgi:hypothetical protein